MEIAPNIMSNVPFFIHIGAHKTGTSAIQYLLNEQYSTLLEEGVLYPQSLRTIQTNKIFYSHHDLAWYLGFGNKKSRLSNPNSIQTNLETEINTTNPKKIILSAEAFGNFPDNLIPLKNLKLLTGEANCTFLYYVRRQDKFIESAYKQMGKNGAIADFSKFAKRQRIFFDEKVKKIQSVFPNAQFIVKPFPESNKSLLLPDFLFQLGIQNEQIINKSKNYQKNESPSLELISHLQYLFKNTPKSEQALIKKFRLILEKKEIKKPTATLLNNAILKELKERYSTSNEALSKMFPEVSWTDFLNWPTSIDESNHFNVNALNKYDQNVISFTFDLWKKNIDKNQQTKKGV